MSTPFDRTLRSLGSMGRPLHQAGVLGSVAALASLLICLGFVEVPVVASSVSARLEVSHQGHPVVADQADRVVENLVELGQRVERGELLLRLDNRQPAHDLEQERATSRALEAEIEAVEGVREAARGAARDAARGYELAISEARVTWKTAVADARFADRELALAGQLVEEGISPRTTVRESELQAIRAAAVVEEAALGLARVEAEAARDRQDRAGALHSVERDLEEARGALATSIARQRQLRTELSRRQVRAPVAGALVEWRPPTVGDRVGRGQRLGLIVPSGEIQAVGEFLPEEALGRVHSGQTAEVRLDGFPWIEYGSHPAKVDKVAGESLDGVVRVVLTLEVPTASRLPLEHGLPGRVLVNVERASPLQLLLRSVGASRTRPEDEGGG